MTEVPAVADDPIVRAAIAVQDMIWAQTLMEKARTQRDTAWREARKSGKGPSQIAAETSAILTDRGVSASDLGKVGVSMATVKARVAAAAPLEL